MTDLLIRKPLDGKPWSFNRKKLDSYLRKTTNACELYDIHLLLMRIRAQIHFNTASQIDIISHLHHIALDRKALLKEGHIEFSRSFYTGGK